MDPNCIDIRPYSPSASYCKTASKMWPMVALVCLCLLLLFTFSLLSEAGITAEEVDMNPAKATNPLDGCHHVYLDMGTNMWVVRHQPPRP